MLEKLPISIFPIRSAESATKAVSAISGFFPLMLILINITLLFPDVIFSLSAWFISFLNFSSCYLWIFFLYVLASLKRTNIWVAVMNLLPEDSFRGYSSKLAQEDLTKKSINSTKKSRHNKLKTEMREKIRVKAA
ncbi:hypothetical protein SDC9_156748 [bioreactor metagenome]|uniref:Uncharacterized protein n=1 Tax=bioreactor metagenome TaxID=1076179 RepID=A0A645F521_9ZZZZ